MTQTKILQDVGTNGSDDDLLKLAGEALKRNEQTRQLPVRVWAEHLAHSMVEAEESLPDICRTKAVKKLEI